MHKGIFISFEILKKNAIKTNKPSRKTHLLHNHQKKKLQEIQIIKNIRLTSHLDTFHLVHDLKNRNKIK